MDQLGGVEVFGPEEIRCLEIAVERAWSTLEFAFSDKNVSDARTMRERIASHAIFLFRRGEHDPLRLSSKVLSSLPPMSATGS